MAAFVAPSFVVDEDAGEGHGHRRCALLEAAGEDACLRIDLQRGGFHRGGDANGVWLREGEGLNEGGDERGGEVEL